MARWHTCAGEVQARQAGPVEEEEAAVEERLRRAEKSLDDVHWRRWGKYPRDVLEHDRKEHRQK